MLCVLIRLLIVLIVFEDPLSIRESRRVGDALQIEGLSHLPRKELLALVAKLRELLKRRQLSQRLEAKEVQKLWRRAVQKRAARLVLAAEDAKQATVE